RTEAIGPRWTSLEPTFRRRSSFTRPLQPQPTPRAHRRRRARRRRRADPPRVPFPCGLTAGRWRRTRREAAGAPETPAHAPPPPRRFGGRPAGRCHPANLADHHVQTRRRVVAEAAMPVTLVGLGHAWSQQRLQPEALGGVRRLERGHPPVPQRRTRAADAR